MKDDLQRRLREDETVQELETLLWEQAEKVNWQPAKAILAWVCDCLNGKVPVEKLAKYVDTISVGHHAVRQNRPLDELIVEKLLRGEMSSSIITKGDKRWIG